MEKLLILLKWKGKIIVTKAEPTKKTENIYYLHNTSIVQGTKPDHILCR
jgi:hypothetical protein